MNPRNQWYFVRFNMLAMLVSDLARILTRLSSNAIPFLTNGRLLPERRYMFESNNRSVNSTAQSEYSPNHRFENSPRPNRVQDRIQKIGEHTVMAVFRVRMMMRMVTWRLQQPDALKKRDDRPVLYRRAMCPLVNLIGICAQRHK